MISTVTTTVTMIAASGLGLALGGTVVLALLLLLAQREVVTSAGPRLRPLARNLAVAILPLLALALGLAWWLRSRQLLGLATLALVAVAFTCAQVFIGTLPPFLRYWSYTTIFTVVLAGACVAGLERVARGSATALRHGMTALLAVGVLLCANGMRDESASFDERPEA